MLYTLKQKFGNMKAILPSKENPLDFLNSNVEGGGQQDPSRKVIKT
jgi:hypothetical protein